jgi:Ribonuclease G/E
MRLLYLSASREDIKRIELTVSPDVEDYLQNYKRTAIAQLEGDSARQIIIRADSGRVGKDCTIVCYDERESVVKL